MKTKSVNAVLLSLAAALMSAAVAHAEGRIRIGINSQQYGPHVATARASITARQVSPRLSTTPAPASSHSQRRQQVSVVKTIGGAATDPLPGYPSLTANSPILKNPEPLGPSSFWYGAGGYACIYSAGSSPLCYRVVRGAASVRQVISPQAVAASVARRLTLAPGSIKTSPLVLGLTGADTWFWLDPAPQRQTLSVSLAGETVSVVADPTVEWRFGDGASLRGGPGVAYQASAVSVDAIRHVYETRCLPGDQGHDPYVLSTCGRDGYGVDAVVVWRFSYSAAGPVGGSGTLPTRTTESATSFAVNESRAFLVSGSGQ
jgi:hypothetical protein